LRLGSPDALRIGALAAAFLGALVLILVATSFFTDPPDGLWLSRETVYADYPVSTREDERLSRTGRTAYLADPRFWSLLPQAWREIADWEVVVGGPAPHIEAEFNGAQLRPGAADDPSADRSFEIPHAAIHGDSTIVLIGAHEKRPTLMLRWRRSHLYRVPYLQPAASERADSAAGAGVLTLKGRKGASVAMRGPWPPPYVTVMVWVRPTARRQLSILTNDDDVGNRLSLQLTIDRRTGHVLSFLSSNGVDETVLESSEPVPLRRWTLVSLTIARRTVRLYFNGRFTGALRLHEPVKPTTLPLVLGADRSGSHYYYRFRGDIGGLQLLPIALTPAEVQQQAIGSSPPPRGVAKATGFVATTRAVAGMRPVVWWREHILLLAVLACLFYVTLAGLALWGWRCLKPRLSRGRDLAEFLAVLGATVAMAALTTNWDVQLFKGFAERYWLYGPIPALTLSGYGPVVDFCMVVPALPYLLLSNAVGLQSEFALNLAIRLPFIVGWIVLLGATSKLVRLVATTADKNEASSYRLLFVLNPLLAFITLWQPEALLVGLVVASIAFLLEGRPMLGGALLGVAVAGKYWPVFIVPVVTAWAWRRHSRSVAVRWLSMATATAGILIAAYWLPTLLKLGSRRQFADLLRSRMPYFGGSEAESQATLWSLYRWPKDLLSGTRIEVILGHAEQASFLIVLVAVVALTALAATRGCNALTMLMGAGAILAAVAGINSLTVPHFALWSLPFVAVAAEHSPRKTIFRILAVLTTAGGVLVFAFAEPISYLLLHSSAGLDRFAYRSAGWLLHHVVNGEIAAASGFVFALSLCALAVVFAHEIAQERAAGFVRRIAAVPGRAVRTVRE
jgi:hypothetical protein